MGKRLSFLIAACILFFSATGLGQTHKGYILLNAGLSSGYGYPSKLTSTENSDVSTANLSGEYFLNKYFSIGPYAAYTYQFYKFQHPDFPYKDVWRGWDFGLRTNFNFSPAFFRDEQAIIYLTAFGGYSTFAMRHDRENIYRQFIDFENSGFSADGIAGFRYFIKRRFGLYAEAGMSRKFFVGGGVSLRLTSQP
jgi:hypothetical protein